jgi:hypothetical protein
MVARITRRLKHLVPGCVQLSWDQGGAKKEIQESVTKVRLGAFQDDRAPLL